LHEAALDVPFPFRHVSPCVHGAGIRPARSY